MPISGDLVLLLEPDEAVRSALASSLKQHGWQVELLGQSEDIAASLGEAMPTAVISESSLPGKAAFAVLEACKAAGVPIIYLGHRAETQGAVDLMRKGAFYFLEKPFPQKRLLEVLEELRADKPHNAS